MKSKVLSLITVLVIVLASTKLTSAANLNNSAYTILNDISAINKIELHGNVELYISDASSDQVKVYNQYYAESALVQSKNGVLRISSYKNEKLVVWVSANDLRAISAYDNSEVKSFGSLSKIEFNVDLHDNASAKLDLDAYSANVTVADHAKVNLSGNATEFSLNHNVSASVNSFNFAAAHYTENKTNFPVTIKEDEMAGI
ncbi:GIN domain-containing protein [Mucilaginibacter sp.]|uniref:GIN domain-containing protein n=1 Tax=Mucilaginibacter sp. TaxID=1882438 RepID=UPI003D0BE05B